MRLAPTIPRLGRTAKQHRKMSIVSSLGLFELLVLPPLIFIVSGLSLYNFKNLLLFVEDVATQTQTNGLLKQAKPMARNAHKFFHYLFGQAKNFSWTFTDVLLVGVILVLCAVLNTQLRMLNKRKKTKIA